MNDSFIELLVKRKNTTTSILTKAVLLIIAALTFCIGFLIPVFFPFAILILWVEYIVYMRFDVEYEYIFLNGELEVDKIMGKKKRKKVATFDVKKFEIVAPINSTELKDYDNKKYAILDCSSGEKKDNVYVAISVYKNEPTKMLFEPNEDLIKAIKMYIPRKVF